MQKKTIRNLYAFLFHFPFLKPLCLSTSNFVQYRDIIATCLRQVNNQGNDHGKRMIITFHTRAMYLLPGIGVSTKMSVFGILCT